MMTSTDPIADMLTRIRNAASAGIDQLSLPHSGTKEDVAKVLAASGFIAKVSLKKDGSHKSINIVLNEDGSSSRISHIKRLSKPGRRLYVKADRIPVVRRGRGIVILSTSKGIMSDSQARQKKLGGELICEVF